MRPTARYIALAASLATAAVAGACAANSAGEPVYRPDLSGDWALDPAAGNDSSALGLALADSADPRLLALRGHRRPPSTGADITRDRQFREPDPIATARSALAVVREPPPRITISATDSLVTFRFDGQQDVALSTAWVPMEAGWGDDRSWRLRARWREGRLEVERLQPQDGGVRLREYYSRSPGADRLVVWTAIELPGDELTVRRVYRLAEPATRSESEVEAPFRDGPRARRP
jgi:hypothetical protein